MFWGVLNFAPENFFPKIKIRGFFTLQIRWLNVDGWYFYSKYSGLVPSFPYMCPWLAKPDPRFPKEIYRPLGLVGLTALMYGPLALFLFALPFPVCRPLLPPFLYIYYYYWGGGCSHSLAGAIPRFDLERVDVHPFMGEGGVSTQAIWICGPPAFSPTHPHYMGGNGEEGVFVFVSHPSQLHLPILPTSAVVPGGATDGA